MTTLKFKDTDGSWKLIPITGPPGAGVPAGGAAGDLLIKQSATDRDTRWGINPPKLDLGGVTDQYTNVLRILDSTHATSRRAAIALGSGWGLGQDLNANGTKDHYVYNTTTNRNRMLFAADDSQTKHYAGSHMFFDSTGATDWAHIDGGMGGGGIFFTQGGGGLYMSDTTWIRTYGAKSIFTGTGTFRSQGGFEAEKTGWMIYNPNDTDTGLYYYGADDIALWRANGATGLRITGADVQITGNLPVSGQVYCGSGAYFRVRGAGSGIYWDNVGGGLVMNAANWLQMYPGCNLSMEFGSIRLRNYTDGNHRLNHTTATIRGNVQDGPELCGWTTLVLRTGASGRDWMFLDSSGNAFTPNTWTTYSSRATKCNIEALDPADCLADVLQWEPIAFDRVDKGPLETRQEGFIAEDMLDVSPNLVAFGEDGVTPLGIAYPQATVRLTGAIQALAARIAALEAA